MANEVQGLQTVFLKNAYLIQEEEFLNHCEGVHVSKIPHGSNVIGNHVIYKIKILNDKTFFCKARIAPRGNHDNEKHLLTTIL